MWGKLQQLSFCVPDRLKDSSLCEEPVSLFGVPASAGAVCDHFQNENCRENHGKHCLMADVTIT